ncbi:proline racemase family protein [Arthrobacter sp. NPDC058097]|uniref:proline racemase family protein n=1 Tax=Arthrobacter sp. NPDC058097 TaxID=3346340 RepID=UPI0036DCED0D
MAPRKVIRAIDVHAAGEPGRVVPGGDLLVRGATMSERLVYCQEHLDEFRRLLLQEPRGYPSLCGVIITSPVNPGSAFGIIVFEHGGFRPMSGSNCMCAVTAMVETGAVKVEEPISRLRIDTAAGVVEVVVTVENGRVIEVSIENVPSFVVELDHKFELPEYGTIPADIVFGGQFYVQARAEDLGLKLEPGQTREILRAGSLLREVARRTFPVVHPEHPEISGISLAMIHGATDTPGADARNAVVCPNGPVDPGDPGTWTSTLDRSPCGTGTSGRMAAKFARGELTVGQEFVHESMIGSFFRGHIRGTAEVAGRPAVLPTVAGRAWITGFHDFVLEDDDPYPTGFRVGDIWGAVN